MPTVHYDRLATIDPGVILAEMPGALGFYPTESFIIAGLEITDTGVTVSPVMRADLDIDRLEASAAQMVNRLGVTDYIVIICATDTCPDLFVDMSIFKLDPLGVFTVETLETDAPYALQYTNTPPLLEHWATGRVAPVHRTQTMKAALERGDVLALTRDDATKKFAYDPDSVAPITLESVQKMADDLITHLEAQPAGEKLNRTYRQYSNEWRAADNEDLLAYTLAACRKRHPKLRDLFMADVCDDPANYRDALLTAARITSGTARANALCIYSLITNDSDAMLALEAAHVAGHDHSLTNLLLEVRKFKRLQPEDLRGAFDKVRDSIA